MSLFSFQLFSRRALGLALVGFLLTSTSAWSASPITRLTDPNDPCDPTRIKFDPFKTCPKKRDVERSRKHQIGVRIEYGATKPLTPELLSVATEPDLIASEALVRDWAISRLELDSDAIYQCILNTPGSDGTAKANACINEERQRAFKRYEDYVEKLQSTNADELEDELRARFPERAAEIQSERLKTALLVNRVLAQPNARAALDVLRTEGQTLSVRERLLLVQRMGGIFVSKYDQVRNNLGLRSKGALTFDDVLTFHREREIERPGALSNLYGFPALDGPTRLGVCRDIASAQGEMLEALGFKNTYIVAHFNTQTLHTTLITEDPEHQGRVYRINYDDLRTAPGANVEMLYQDEGGLLQDTTLRYYIHRPGGETITTVPSELNLLITRALRGDAAMDELAPGYVPKGHLIAIDLDLYKALRGRAFEGTNSRGERYYGAGIVLAAGNEDSIGRIEIGGAQMRRMAGPMTLDETYAFIEAGLRSPDIKFDEAKRYRMHTEALFYFAGMLGNQRDYIGNLYVSADARVAAAATFNGGLPTDRVNVNVKTQVQLTPGVHDVRDLSSIRAQIDQFIVEAEMFYFLSKYEEGRIALKKNPAGRAYLYAIGTVMFDEWGQRGVGRMGVSFGTTELEARVAGRFQDDSPRFRIVSVREAGVRVAQKLGSLGHIYAEALQPLEDVDGVFRQYRVGGQVGVPWGPRNKPKKP